jgi:hypothetical protein
LGKVEQGCLDYIRLPELTHPEPDSILIYMWKNGPGSRFQTNAGVMGYYLIAYNAWNDIWLATGDYAVP